MSSSPGQASAHNPHWEQLAATGNKSRLVQDIGAWKFSFEEGLHGWLEQAPPQFQADAEAILLSLSRLQPDKIVDQWELWRDHLADINDDASLLRERFLRQRGPTQNSALNAILFSLESLESSTQPHAAGTAILRELRRFEEWAEESGIVGPALDDLVTLVESLALSLLNPTGFSPARFRAEIQSKWDILAQAVKDQAVAEALSVPTRSPRWNSWILALQEAEKGAYDPLQMLTSLDGLDGDVGDLEKALQDDPQIGECLSDYRDASAQLRANLTTGKQLKGWSQVLPPLLQELDQLWPHEVDLEPGPPLSRVRSLSQQLEAGSLSPEAFHRGLEELSESLQQARAQARLNAAQQHPHETTFLQALAKLEGGLEILRGVERASQAGQMEMGCTLVEEGLAQVQALQQAQVETP